MSIFVPSGKTPEISETTLIIPSISIGNIPQLAIDLLIHTLSFKKIGKLDDFYLYPFASPIDYAKAPPSPPCGVSSPCEVYYNDLLKLTLIQQRSPIISSYTRNFINEVLLPFVTDHNFKQVIILDSFDAGLVENVSIEGIKVFHNDDLISEFLKKLKLNNQKLINEDEGKNSDFVKLLLEALHVTNSQDSVGESRYQVSVLVSYVYEGDNFQDGEKLADKLTEVLKIDNKQWIRPYSWQGAYGDKPVPSSMEEGIYG